MRILLALILLTACSPVQDKLITVDLRPAIVACLERNQMLIGVKVDSDGKAIAGICIDFPKAKPLTEAFK